VRRFLSIISMALELLATRCILLLLASINRRARLSFSQEGEDLALEELNQWRRVTGGFYVDVGAHHPWRFSNTAIYHLRGWTGINIDPTPRVMRIFQKLRPEDINLELAISSEESERMFYMYNESALNGIDCDRSEDLAGTGCRLLEKIPVNAVPLAKVLSQHCPTLPQPNFLTVDAEGHDLEVLKSNDWSRFPFEWVLVEVGGCEADDISCSPTGAFLKDAGYRLRAFTGRTGIFERTSAG